MEMEAGQNIVPRYLAKEGYYSGLMLKGNTGKLNMGQFDWYDMGKEREKSDLNVRYTLLIQPLLTSPIQKSRNDLFHLIQVMIP